MGKSLSRVIGRERTAGLKCYANLQSSLKLVKYELSYMLYYASTVIYVIFIFYIFLNIALLLSKWSTFLKIYLFP